MTKSIDRAPLLVCTLAVLLVTAGARAQAPTEPAPAQQAPDSADGSLTPPPAGQPTPPPGYGTAQPAPQPQQGQPQQGQPQQGQPVYQQPASNNWVQPGTVAPVEQDIRFIDANVDRLIISSTAETHPAGTIFFSDYELILLQLGYAITDNVQLSLTTFPPLVEDQPYFFDFTLKANFLRTEQFRAAVLGSLDVLFDDDGDGYWGARVGGVAQVCFQPECRSSFVFSATTFFNDQIDEFLPFVLAGGISWRFSDVVGAIIEPMYALAIGDGGIDTVDGFLLNYGIRISGRNLGVDVAFVRPIGGDSPFVLGVPWVSFTYRTDWDPRSNPAVASSRTPEPLRMPATAAF